MPCFKSVRTEHSLTTGHLAHGVVTH